jgi:hypothetical protein
VAYSYAAASRYVSTAAAAAAEEVGKVRIVSE